MNSNIRDVASKKVVLFFILLLISFNLLFLLIIKILYSISYMVPSGSPVKSFSKHDLDIYNDLSTPYFQLNFSSIKQFSIENIKLLDQLDPFIQIVEFSKYSNVLKLLLLFFVILYLVQFILYNFFNKIITKNSEILIIFNSTCISGFAFVIWFINSIRGGWDEIFIFATQAKNLFYGFFPFVPISGPIGRAESSSDFLITLLSGWVFRLTSILKIETAIFITYLFLLLIAYVVINLLLVKRFDINIFFANFLSFLFTFALPSSTLSTGDLNPSGIAYIYFLIFILSLLIVLEDERINIWYLLISLIMVFVRWEFGIVVVFTNLLLIFYLRFASLEKRHLFFLMSPFILFSILTLLRVIFFNQFGPSGAIGKSVGVDGGYLRSSLDYFSSTNQFIKWLFIYSISLALISISKKSFYYRFILIIVSSLPLISALLAGGDWFPREWARYVLPSTMSIFVASLLLFRSSFRLNLLYKVSLTLTVFLPFLLSSSLYQLVYNNYVQPEYQYRTNCLARVGLIINQLFPQDVSVATAEVNTIGFYSSKRLTDLVGLVDPRVAILESTPLSEGDVLHRKASRRLIEEDRPEVIYLYESARCFGNSFENGNMDFEIILNSEITRFRLGDPNRFMKNYYVLKVSSKNEIEVYLLIRNDLRVST